LILREETAAERKQREKEEAKAAKEQEKANEATARLADSSKMKMEPVILELQACIGNANFKHVTSVVAQPIQQHLKDLMENVAACDAGGPLQFDVKTLAMQIARIKKDLVLCKSMLCTIARAAR
jgi:hypothetical protein